MINTNYFFKIEATHPCGIDTIRVKLAPGGGACVLLKAMSGK